MNIYQVVYSNIHPAALAENRTLGTSHIKAQTFSYNRFMQTFGLKIYSNIVFNSWKVRVIPSPSEVAGCARLRHVDMIDAVHTQGQANAVGQQVRQKW